MSSEDHKYDVNSVEKNQPDVGVYVVTDGRHQFDVASVQMIAICRVTRAGTLGTGLFLGSGKALSGAGPLSALIAYALVGSVAYSSLCSIVRFPHFAARWVDPALGFAVGWNYFYVS
ncbi:lysine-specific permease [Suillus fuscotomentosus]|uniref:Lysine-specific permease n=1 Tax=Suillus fuscotomentosus TaxID=1912939 RepID=A0AAD4HFX6_9AGAM|nr:lysine-specific permease [Suillus fuscotomentosus]XP_041219635.1 lysine-specific permease [Suillus fuscotomentosus]KAG1894047.1 lysine-specific permease [Suillus fuscotomentosus]KAG1894059.1 lysine-specific permease [Suillus fuscotomentosus]